MKNDFSEEQKISIVSEAVNSKNKAEVSAKYKIHKSTLYNWINIYHHKRNRTVNIKVRVTEDEKKLLFERASSLGFKNDVSTYVRKILFSKYILIGNPKEVREELYRTRGEINKIGSNVNQIAQYTNFLSKQKYIERDFIKDIIDETTKLKALCYEQRGIIDKALRKIFR